MNRSVHALKPPSDGTRDAFGVWLRRRPSAPLLALLRRRLTTFDADRILRRSERGQRTARGLPLGVFHPGREGEERTHWVFPVAVGDPDRTIEILRAAGFDATAGTSWIVTLEPPPGREELRPEASAFLMEHVVSCRSTPSCRTRPSIVC